MSFTQKVALNPKLNDTPSCCRLHHFRLSASDNAVFSSIVSASSFFNFLFSLSSSFRRLASDTAMPPYFAFQV